MSSRTSSTTSSTPILGIGFTGLLTIVFIVLKLTNVINWSWLWVLSPLWIEFALVIAIILIVLGVTFLIIKPIKNRKDNGK